MQPSSFNKAMSCALGKVGKPKNGTEEQTTDGNTARLLYGKGRVLYGYRWTQQVHIYRMSFCCLHTCLASTLESQKQHIAIIDLHTTFLHSVAAHCSRIIIFDRIFLLVICEFS